MCNKICITVKAILFVTISIYGIIYLQLIGGIL